MYKKIILLGGLLALQVALMLTTTFRSTGLPGQQSVQALLDFDRAQVDRVVVADGDQSTELLRKGDGWETVNGFPAEVDRVDRLLDRLGGLEHGLAIAQTDAALKRFKLTDTDFERRVQLYAGDEELASLTLGSGAGARRSNVRAGDAKAVYTVQLGSYDLPADVAQWQDKTLLQLDADAVLAIELGDLKIRKEVASPAETDSPDAAEAPAEPETTWVAEGLADGEQFDLDNFKRDFDRLRSLRYDRAYPHPDLAELVEGDAPVNTLRFDLADGGSRSYEIYRAKDGDGHLLKVSDRDELFELNASLGSRLGEQLASGKWTKADAATAAEPSDEAVAEPASAATEILDTEG